MGEDDTLIFALELQDNVTEVGAGIDDSLESIRETAKMAQDAITQLELDLTSLKSLAAEGVQMPPISGLERLGGMSQLQGAMQDPAISKAAAQQAKGLNILDSAMNGLGADAEAATGKVSGSIQSMGEKSGGIMGMMGRQFLYAVPFALAGTGIAAIKMAGDFQSSMTQLVTGAGEAQSNMKMVSDGILDMAGNVGETPAKLASGMYLIESAGYHGADGLKVLQASAEGAKVGNSDLATVSNAVTTALNAYPKGTYTAVQATNDLIAAVGEGKMHMQDLSTALSSVAPTAAAAGVSLPQVTGAIATLTAQGKSAQDAALDVKDLIQSFADPSGQQIAYMQQLGINVTDLTKNVGKNGLTGSMDILTEAIAHHTQGGMVALGVWKQSQSASQDLQKVLNSMPASVRNVASAFENGTITSSQLRKELSAKDYAVYGTTLVDLYKKANGFNDAIKAGNPAALSMEAALQKLTGTTTATQAALDLGGSHAAEFSDNVKHISSTVSNSGNDIQGWADIQKDANQKIAEAWDGIQAAVIKNVMPALQKFGDWVSHNKTAIIGAVTTAFHVLGTTMQVAANIIGFVTSHSWLLVPVLTIIGEIITMKLITGFIGMGKSAVTAVMSIVTALGPWGLALAALGIVVMEIITHWDDVKKAVMPIIDAIGKGIGEFVGFVKDHWALLISILLPVLAPIILIATHFTQLRDIVGGVLRDITAGLAVFTAFVGNTINNVGNFFGQLGNFIVGVLKEPINAVIDIVNGAIDAIDNIKFTVPGWVPGIGGKGWQGLGIGHIPNLAAGGIVPATPGGVMVNVAEAGHDEAIIPLDSPHAPGGGGGGTNVTLHLDLKNAVISDDRAINKLADKVGREVVKQFVASGGNKQRR